MLVAILNEIMLDCFKLRDEKITMLNIINDIKHSYINTIKSPSPNSIQFIELVGLSVSEYNYGKHCSAYLLFKTAMSYLDIQALIRSLSSKFYYRLRCEKIINQEEMFHIPFDERYKVGTQRYSFPGLPCLYLGSSVAVCKEELRDKILTDCSIARYKLQEGVAPKIFDLSFFFDMEYDNMDTLTRKKFLDLLPLIALCSIRCEYPKDDFINFKKEYVIPQMFLEYLMDTQPFGENDVIGIKYRSVYHMNDVFKQGGEVWNNYVFPAISNQPSGLSNELQRLFTFSNFVS